MLIKRLVIAVACTSEVVIAQPSCTVEDYLGLAAMDPAQLTTCVDEDNFIDCAGNATIANMTVACGSILSAQIPSFIYYNTGVACGGINAGSVLCGNAKGAIIAMQTAVWGPDSTTGACSSEDDLSAIANVDLSLVNDCGLNSTSVGGTCLLSAAGASPRCQVCMATRVPHIVSDCGDLCAGNETTADCQTCSNYGFMAAMAFCLAEPYAEANCTATDYNRLAAIDSPVVGSCINDAAEGTDGFLQCFTDVQLANLTEGCVATVETHIQERTIEVCNCTQEDTPCWICRTIVTAQETFEHAPAGAGACGDSNDLRLMANVDTSLVFECSDVPESAATCLASESGASRVCQKCLAWGTDRTVSQCESLCVVDQTDPACLECVTVGLMSSGAYCNAHMSGVADQPSLTVIAIAAVLLILIG